jgi:hypothetical protein
MDMFLVMIKRRGRNCLEQCNRSKAKAALSDRQKAVETGRRL